jgi:hypothetical protein
MAKTAKEVLDELAKDPNYVAMKKRQEKERKAFERKMRFNEKPLVKALWKAGISVNSVWDLVNTNKPYPKALPVLIEHLRGEYHPKILAGIARALAVRDPFAIEHAWPVALDLYLKTEDDKNKEPELRGFKEALAVALSALYTDERLPQVFELIRDPSHGESRGHFFYGLRRFCKDEEVREFLETLYDDPQWGELARNTAKGARMR